MTADIIDKLVKIVLDPIHPAIERENEAMQKVIAIMPPIDRLRLIRVLGHWVNSDEGTRYLENLKGSKP